METTNPTIDRLEDQIAWYDAKSGSNQFWFRALKIIEIVIAASIPFLAGFDAPHVLTGIAGVVAAPIGVVSADRALEAATGTASRGGNTACTEAAAAVRDGLIKAGRDAKTPAGVFARGTRPDAQTVVGTLDELPALAQQAGEGPALLVIGEVVARSDVWRTAENHLAQELAA